MAQAKRKPQKKPRRVNRVNAGHAMQGLGMLGAGIVIGSLATIMYQGMQKNDNGVGAGIREMIEQSKQAEQLVEESANNESVPEPEKLETNFDFFTVLPEIEVVVPDNVKPEAPKIKPVEQKPADQSVANTTLGSAYMLQAGSYQREADAERLKATLALKGMQSSIQKVSIQGRGDFYRVRLGPFDDHSQMVVVDDQLSSDGIKALRLKISRQQ